MEKSTTGRTSAFQTTDLVYIALFTVLITICSWISIPAPVPFTLQTFSVFAACYMLGGRRAALSVVVYLLLGTAGLPVFAGFTGGAGILLGSTGGYLIGFILTTLLFSIFEKMFGRHPVTDIIGLILGLLSCYFFGTIWFMKVYARANGAIGWISALSWCVIPFIIPDLIKLALAVIVGSRVRHLMPAQYTRR